MGTHRLTPQGPFSLAESIRFLEGFAPIRTPSGPEGLRLAFDVEGDWRAVGAHVTQEADGAVIVELGVAPGASGAPASDAIETAGLAQVRRILSLDIDGAGFAAIGRRDPVVGALQERMRGLRPVCFWSPYEAAAWAVIGNRIRMVQAAAIKQRMAEQLGTEVEIGGERISAFPSPTSLLAMQEFPGLTSQKVERLHAVARAALGGLLDAERLRSLPVDQALTEIQTVHGLGPFSAELVLLRGAGEPDRAPLHEPRFLRAVEHVYGRTFDEAELAELVAGWAPYRTWATLLMRVALESDTHEIARSGRGGRR